MKDADIAEAGLQDYMHGDVQNNGYFYVCEGYILKRKDNLKFY